MGTTLSVTFTSNTTTTNSGDLIYTGTASTANELLTFDVSGHSPTVADGVGGGEYVITGSLGPNETDDPNNWNLGGVTANVTGAELDVEGDVRLDTFNLDNATLKIGNPTSTQGHSYDAATVVNFTGGTNQVIFGSYYDTGLTLNGSTSDPGGSTAIKINGFTAGDSIVGPNGADTISAISYNSTTGTLSFKQNGTTYTLSVTLGTGYHGFTSSGGTLTASTACFASGARILTSWGYVAVEDLAMDDVVVTALENGPQTQKIKWVGQRTIDLTRHVAPEKVQPVRISAGAFAPGMPERDLRVSPDHALYIDGHLIEAKNLVNGVTIVQEHGTKSVTYFHVELPSHDVLLAEGLPAESYLDTGNRAMFENEGPLVLHPDFGANGRDGACAPLLLNGEILVAARQRLLDRAIALGYGLTTELDLVARAEGRDLAVVANGNALSITVPAGVASVDLISSVGVPAEVSAQPGDRRQLGVSVCSLALVSAAGRSEIALEDAAHEGFHGLETAGEVAYRWTNGAARVALPHAEGGVLEVTLLGEIARWVETKRRNIAVAV